VTLARLLTACFALTLLGAGAQATCCPVIELRQYTLFPDKRDDLVQLFEDQFIEPQEAAGITAIGQFRVMDDPNKFYWLRGFASMADRATGLAAFYHGPVWRKYRGVANPWLLENNNVLLLHPAHEGSGFAAPTAARPPIGSTAQTQGLMVAEIYFLGPNTGSQFDAVFEKTIRPVMQDAGARIVATLATEHSPNNYPSLPIRDDANVFVSIACYADDASYQQFKAARNADRRWWTVVGNFALAQMYVPPEVDRLLPTPRSALRCER
jgi:hypothetical protein